MTVRREDIPAIADEYVLGLLDPAEAVAVEAELERNESLRTAVAASRDRFLPLDTALEPASVDDSLWNSIENGLARIDAAAAVAGPKAANDNPKNAWRVAALSSFAATLLLAVSLAWSLMRTVEPVVVAVLLNDAGEVPRHTSLRGVVTGHEPAAFGGRFPSAPAGTSTRGRLACSNARSRRQPASPSHLP